MSFETDTGRDLYFVQLEKELAELIDDKTGLLGENFSKAVDCPLCHANDDEPLFVKRGYTFVRCRSCGMIYSNPQVLQDVVIERYKSGLPSTEMWMDVLKNRKETAWRQDYYKSILDEIAKHVSVGRLLDVGCAVGHFLEIARKDGWDVTGLELSEKGCSYCREVLGLNVLNKNIEECALPENSFDAITLIGVLEHVTDPVGIVQACRKLLKNGGVVLVVVPNVYSLLNMVIREKAVTFDGRNHLLYFSQKTLEKLIRDAGMDVVLSDTMLAGIPNLVKYLQYFDPYVNNATYKYLPESLQEHFQSEKGRLLVEEWLLSMNLGLRLRVIGQKRN